MSDVLYYLATEIPPAIAGGVIGALIVFGLILLRSR